MTPTRQNLAVLLDETISSLSCFDSVRLETLERETMLLANVETDQVDIDSVMRKKEVLQTLLENCEANLNVLKRLHARNRMDRWVQ